jgi:23S rRNA (uracil1939-C5)-methyltransferase
MPAFELEIDDLSHDARGIGRIDGKAVFIAGALPGERVAGGHLHNGRNFDSGTAEQILRASPDRIEPKCQHFGGCAGCSLQHLRQSAQIHFKQNMLLQDLKKIGRCEPETVLPPLFDADYGYRRKARLSVKDVAKKGKVLVGFREPDGRYVADLSRCETLHSALGLKIAELARLIESLDARKHIAQIEASISEGDHALVFRNLVALSETDQAKLLAFGSAHGFAIWLQPSGLDSVFRLDGKESNLFYTLPDFNIRIDYRPLDFTQVNFELNRKMVEQALQLLAPAKDERILDLFCGLGNFTLAIAARGARVTGVEGDKGLVLRAQANAARNGFAETADFFAADLSQASARETQWANVDYDKILLDPARAGADAVLHYLPKSSCTRVVYVSCNPATLARDAEILVHQHGFKLKAAGVMDMFSHTTHVESMAWFERP